MFRPLLKSLPLRMSSCYYWLFTIWISSESLPPGLSGSQQALVFRPAPRGYRKVVAATNVAETSLTLEGGLKGVGLNSGVGVGMGVWVTAYGLSDGEAVVADVCRLWRTRCSR